MFKTLILGISILLSQSIYAQITLEKIASVPLIVKSVIRIDNNGTIYYIDHKNAFVKSNKEKYISYSNIQLGDITSANAFNDLKINLYYKNFNTIILLDNRLAEIFRIDLNSFQPYKNISHISTGYDNSLWMFNEDLQQLELYDYKAKKFKLSAMPVQSSVLDLKTDYNYAWLLTEGFLYIYNYQGSLVEKYKNEGSISLFQENENVLLFDGQNFKYLDTKSKQMQALEMPQLLIKQFLLANETLYIYDGEILHQFQLKIK